MIKCPCCGAELSYDVGLEKVKCDYCGTTFNPKELETKVSKSKKVKTIDATSYSCTQCGATLLTFDETAVTFCSYCGSSALIEDKMKETAPEYIIPFKITKEQAIAAYKKKIRSSLFVPSEMKKDEVISKFRGIYMPYAIFKAEYNGNCKNKGSKFYKSSGYYDYYNDYSITADIDAKYDGLSYDLISKYYDKYSSSIPYNIKEAEPFNINYVSGFYADAKDIDAKIYEKEALEIMNKDAKEKLLNNKEMKEFGIEKPKVPLEITDKKVGLFPVYFLAVTNNNKKTVNYAVVNGQTGKVAMDLPIDFKKYLLSSLLLTVPLYLLLSLFIVLSAKAVVGYAMIISLISTIFIISEVNKQKEYDDHTDDLGYQSKNKNKKKKIRFGMLKVVKPIFGMFLCLSVFISDTIMDELYYGAAFITLLLVLSSAFDLVKVHNKIMTNKLPQLEKRGGDESE